MLSETQRIYDDYFSLRAVSKNTERIYRRALLSWDRNTGKPISEINQDSLTQWYRAASKQLNPNTIEKYGTQIRTFYAYTLEQNGLSKRKAKAEAQELFDIIPFNDLRQKAKKESNLRDKIVTADEFQAILKAANSQRMKALLSLTYESGCRKGEVFSLRLKDIQVQQNYWTISVDGKTGVRVIPLIISIPYVKAWLQIHPARNNPNTPLFVTSRKGKIEPMNPLSFNTGLRLLCEKTQIRMLHPHQLRHTRLTELAENGLGEFQMKSFAGWTADSKMAAEYVHLSGRGHVNAVLKTEGLDVEVLQNEFPPLIELSSCPNCDRQVDCDMVTCPYCGFILDEKLGISKADDVQQLRAEVKLLKEDQHEFIRQEIEKALLLARNK